MNFLSNTNLIGGILIGTITFVVVRFLFKRKPAAVISPEEYRLFKLIEKKTLTRGELVQSPVNLYRFAIPNEQSLGLPIGKHVSIRAKIGEEMVRRSYTPTSTNDDLGFFDLVIKVYPKGKLSQYIDSLSIGDCIEVAGPKGSFEYAKNAYREIGMLAGGTGITPMLQVVKEIMKYDDDKTKVTLLCGNLTVQDIILREEIDALAARYSHKFKVYHVLNQAPSTGWSQGVGFITKEIIQEHFPAPADDVKILLCGPPPMTKAMREHLTALSFSPKQCFSF